MIETSNLAKGWTLRVTAPAPDAPSGAEGWRLAATVPSVVHTVLMDHGHLPDPYLGQNEEYQHWVGRSEWEYSTTFNHNRNEGQRTELVFGGLDTIAVIRVNGQDLLHTYNQHRGYVLDVSDVIRPGVNELTMTFKNVREYAEHIRASVGDLPNGNPEPFQYVRKSACNFGWDWGPNLVTSGPWKPVGIRRYQTARLQSVRPSITTTALPGPGRGELPRYGRAHVEVDVEVLRAPGVSGELGLKVAILGKTESISIPEGSHKARVLVDLEDVELWWPHDMGAQPLSQLTVTLDADGHDLDVWSKSIGFRQFELKTEKDEAGTSFVFAVNGTDIFVKGANWIPDDCFPSRITEDRLRQRLSQATSANMNLLRVWGGGIYESDAFYELCDRMGILVWQDFLFACAGYPEDGPLAEEVAGEVRDNVTRLMSHPSLVLWNGNNECVWGFWDWDWKPQLDGRNWGWGYYSELLPALVTELDPTRPYWNGSPYSGDPELHPNDPKHGNVHIWDVWNQEDYSRYAEWNARFVSEFGFQGPPNWSTLTRVLEPADLELESPAFLQHQKAEEGTGKLQRGLSAHLPEPANFQEWHFLTQVNQARAIRFGIEHFRAGSPVCAGSIVWQLNDCWPVTSWAAIDGYGQLKPLWYAIREAYRPRLATIQRRGDGLAVVLVNDSAEPWSGTFTAERLRFPSPTESAAPLARLQAANRSVFDVEPRGKTEIGLPKDLCETENPLTDVLVARGDGLGYRDRILHFYAEDKDRITVPARITSWASKVPDGVEVTVTAETIVRDLVLQADRLDPKATVSEQCISLLPGESHTFRVASTVDGADGPGLDVWSRYPVLQGVGIRAEKEEGTF